MDCNMNDLKLCHLMTQCLTELRGEGYGLDQELDLMRGEDRARKVRDKARSAPFSLGLNDFAPSDIFWLFLTQNGDDVGCVAARRETIRRGELTHYFRRSYTRIYGDAHIDIEPKPPEIFDVMHGNVVYMGEFFIQPQHRSNRNLLRRYVHALFVLCCYSLTADWLYAFIPKDHDAFGLGRVYGFQYFDDTALVWKSVPHGRRPETLCVISRPQIYERAAHYAHYPDDFCIPENTMLRQAAR